MHLKRYWHKIQLKKQGALSHDSMQDEWQTDIMLLSALELGLHQTLQHLYAQDPSFDQFENWIIETTGGPDPKKITQFNALFTGENSTPDDIDERYRVYSPLPIINFGMKTGISLSEMRSRKKIVSWQLKRSVIL